MREKLSHQKLNRTRSKKLNKKENLK